MRKVRTAGAAAACLGLLAACGGAQMTARLAGAKAGEETKSLDQLYADAVAEGGTLTIYAGGDTPTQQDAAKDAFLKRFPKMKLNMIVDYSKYHDVRIDNQLATGTLVPDMTQLQTLFDFPRWKKMGVLLDYKPAGSGKVYDKFKDPDGAWAAIGVYSFSTVFNTRLAGGDSAITSPKDLAAATWKGKIQSSYPNDDDAVLYLFRQYVNAYGWDWMSKVAANGVTFARGSNTANDKVTAGSKTVGAGTFGSPVTVAGATVKWLFPADSGFPFMAWGQRAAIFKAAKHPAAAKLYLNWQLSTERQTPNAGWSVRTDVSPPTGLKPIWDYPSANVNGFADFMEDRAAAERWRQTFTLYIGEVQGAPTPGILGLHPGASA